MTTPLVVFSTTIQQQESLYSLNDLHRASGGANKHQPNRFMRLDQTQALIHEIENTQIRAFKTDRGKYGGTFVCRELVIAYAAWINPAFHLKVLQLFLDTKAPQLMIKADPQFVASVVENVCQDVEDSTLSLQPTKLGQLIVLVYEDALWYGELRPAFLQQLTYLLQK